MKRIRVLVVDDSVVVRRLVSEVLSEDDGIEVVGTASNGRIAIEKVEELRPDLVTLDIEMPVMDGLEALREIRRRHPKLPVIMFSTMTWDGGSATLDALASGASDYVPKPTSAGSIMGSMQAIRDELAPKIHALCRRATFRTGTEPGRTGPASTRPMSTRPAAPGLRSLRSSTTPPVTSAPSAVGRLLRSTPNTASPRVDMRAGRIDAIVIGASTGGPNALASVFAQLPTHLGVPILVTQHMPPMFTALFAERLSKLGTIPVVEATTGMMLRPNHAFLAPGDHHLLLDANVPGGRLRISQDPPVNSCRPAVDPMFQSAVRVFGGNLLAVVLTGMGSDGLNGSRLVNEAGGQVVVQDEESSVVWGMPGHVAQAGLAHRVLPLNSIAGEIIARVAKCRPPAGVLTRRVG